jgi:hypothetical protein
MRTCLHRPLAFCIALLLAAAGCAGPSDVVDPLSEPVPSAEAPGAVLRVDGEPAPPGFEAAYARRTDPAERGYDLWLASAAEGLGLHVYLFADDLAVRQSFTTRANGLDAALLHLLADGVGYGPGSGDETCAGAAGRFLPYAEGDAREADGVLSGTVTIVVPEEVADGHERRCQPRASAVEFTALPAAR